MFLTHAKANNKFCLYEFIYYTLDDCFDDVVYSIHSTLAGHSSSPKRQKTEHTMPITFGRIRTSMGRPKPATIKILIDFGASKTMVIAQFV
jgi:hypothetical protein